MPFLRGNSTLSKIEGHCGPEIEKRNDAQALSGVWHSGRRWRGAGIGIRAYRYSN